MSGIGSKLESAARTQQVSQQLKDSVPSLKNALKQMEKSGVMKDMAKFESVFEDLDVQIAGVTGTMDAVAGGTTEDDTAVMDLLRQMQAEQAMAQG